MAGINETVGNPQPESVAELLTSLALRADELDEEVRLRRVAGDGQGLKQAARDRARLFVSLHESLAVLEQSGKVVPGEIKATSEFWATQATEALADDSVFLMGTIATGPGELVSEPNDIAKLAEQFYPPSAQ